MSGVIIIDVTAEDIARSVRGSRYNPVHFAVSRALGTEVTVAQGPSLAAAQDRWKDHRDWAVYVPVGELGELADRIVSPKGQKLLNWWSYGPNGDPGSYAEHVRPLKMRLDLTGLKLRQRAAPGRLGSLPNNGDDGAAFVSEEMRSVG